MSTKKPPPLYPAPTRNRCPICGENSYSSGGVHPQCLVEKAEKERLKQMKRDKQTTAKPEVTVAAWQKTCPNCKALRHVQSVRCGCGYTFSMLACPPTSEFNSS